jgi:hypothetical protein
MDGDQAAVIEDTCLTMIALLRATIENPPDPATETDEVTVLLDNCDLRVLAKMLLGAWYQVMLEYGTLAGDQDPRGTLDQLVRSAQQEFRTAAS